MNFSDIEAQAMERSVSECVQLASHLLHSLPGESEHEDDGSLAEALRREAEKEADLAMCITFEELKRSVGR